MGLFGKRKKEPGKVETPFCSTEVERKEHPLAKEKKKNLARTVALVTLAIANLLGVFVGTYAWFRVYSDLPNIAAVSGDLNVDIKKITAYKWVYPYYTGSTEFINYNADGEVKGYVVEDKAFLETNNVDVTSPFSNTCTISVGRTETLGSYNQAGGYGPRNVNYVDTGFALSLFGDEVFTGVGENPWSNSTAINFAASSFGNEQPAALNNVVLSVGAKFILFAKSLIPDLDATNCDYYTYGAPAESNPRFKVENNCLVCLQSGIYSFSFDGSSLVITLTPRTDNAIIGSGILDPTKINIDYVGSANKTEFPTLASYVPQAVHDQNTMVILDVLLAYKNANPITAGLRIDRNPDNTQSIYRLANRYEDTTSHLTGYLNSTQRNPLNASDFYAYYAVLVTKAESEQSDYSSPSSLWDTMHRLTNVQTDDVNDFVKFSNGGNTFERSIAFPIHRPDLSLPEEFVIPGGSQEANYHCYIAIDYDYEYANFFLKANRLGKTYLLDRDFGFYFSGTQIVNEEASS